MKKLLFASTILAAAAALPMSGAVAAGDSQMKKQNPAATETKGGDVKQDGTTQRDWGQAQKFSETQYRQLEGRTVENLRGQEIGQIENLVAGVQDQNVYAVLGVGGTLGLGERKVAVPVEQLRQDDGVVLMSEKTEAELDNMPAYDDGSDLYKPYTGKTESPWKSPQ